MGQAKNRGTFVERRTAAIAEEKKKEKEKSIFWRVGQFIKSWIYCRG